MPPKLNLAGGKFGRLKVEHESGKDSYGAVLWTCRCDCGRRTRARGSQILSGATRSCGCGVALAASKPRTHGATHTRLYSRWASMIERCRNRHSIGWKNYGGRGIKVCRRWMKFENFARDMGSSFRPDLELDRKRVNGNYGPRNCRWASRREQNLNKRTNHFVTLKDRRLTVQEWAEELGLKPNTIICRLRRGWSVERALSGVLHKERSNA